MKGAKAMLVMRAAANDFLHYWLICQLFSQLIDLYLVYKMSKNGEKWQSLLPKAQDATHVLSQWPDHNPKLFSLLERHTRNQKIFTFKKQHLRSSIPAWDFFLFFIFCDYFSVNRLIPQLTVSVTDLLITDRKKSWFICFKNRLCILWTSAQTTFFTEGGRSEWHSVLLYF